LSLFSTARPVQHWNPFRKYLHGHNLVSSSKPIG
jgi:hypothetical protein